MPWITEEGRANKEKWKGNRKEMERKSESGK